MFDTKQAKIKEDAYVSSSSTMAAPGSKSAVSDCILSVLKRYANDESCQSIATGAPTLAQLTVASNSLMIGEYTDGTSAGSIFD